MNRVLFIARYTHPHPGIGAVRAGQIARLLPAFGWLVTVVTPAEDLQRPPTPELVETSYFDVTRFIKSSLGLAGRRTHEALGTIQPEYGAHKNLRQRAVEALYVASSYATDRTGWYVAARRDLVSLVEERHFDAVLSTGPPQSAHVLASALGKNLPWVADFRDLWLGNPAWRMRPLPLMDCLAERTVLRRAAALVTVSQQLAETLRRRYAKPVFCIPNAFEAEEWDGVAFQHEERCRILYAGAFHYGRRSPRRLFAAVAQLLERGEIRSGDLEIALYVKDPEWLSPLINDYGLKGIASTFPLQERYSIMGLERRADVLWVALFDGEHDEGELPGKLFEYLGARRPILVTGGPPHQCGIDGVLAETGAGKRLNDVDEIARFVKRIVQQHRDGRCKPLEPHAASYEARALAERVAHVLNSVIGKR